MSAIDFLHLIWKLKTASDKRVERVAKVEREFGGEEALMSCVFRDKNMFLSLGVILSVRFFKFILWNSFQIPSKLMEFECSYM